MLIDWDGDGEIDDLDIALTVSLLDDEENDVKEASGCGCLTTMITLFGIVALILTAQVIII